MEIGRVGTGVRAVWGRLMALDGNIRAFLKEVGEQTEFRESHPGVVALTILMLLAGVAVCFFALPIYRTFRRGNREKSPWVKRGVIITHLLLFCVAFSPIVITNVAANKFGTGALCEVCGRPGSIFWAKTDKGSTFAECYCDRHRDRAAGLSDKASSPGKAAGADLGIVTGVSVFFLLVFWGLGTLGTATFSEDDQETACCLAFSLLPLTLLFAWHLYGPWLLTILGPTKLSSP